MKTVLYHGTSAEQAAKILAGGFGRGYLAASSSLARYYAQETCEEDGEEGEEPVVLALELTDTQLSALLPDRAALTEPVGYDGRTSKQLSEAVVSFATEWQMLDGRDSLALVGSAYCEQQIPAAQIRLL